MRFGFREGFFLVSLSIIKYKVLAKDYHVNLMKNKHPLIQHKNWFDARYGG